MIVTGGVLSVTIDGKKFECESGSFSYTVPTSPHVPTEPPSWSGTITGTVRYRGKYRRIHHKKSRVRKKYRKMLLRDLGVIK